MQSLTSLHHIRSQPASISRSDGHDDGIEVNDDDEDESDMNWVTVVTETRPFCTILIHKYCKIRKSFVRMDGSECTQASMTYNLHYDYWLTSCCSLLLLIVDELSLAQSIFILLLANCLKFPEFSNISL